MNKLYIIRVYLVRGADAVLLDTLSAWSFRDILLRRRELVRAGFRVSLVSDTDLQMVFKAV